MRDYYSLSERERLEIVLKSEIERQSIRHKATLAKLRLLAALI
ncbi:Uncharacterised protein [Porphyromonas macacae]|uniref:Uncharacterized protein n=1 Tax=Porphyromonas macacae TaxID=28115 RepID=A0A379E8H4_9PORP|nr:hypothetical protein [Porphyromonas macacae]SUB89003.1 Uncharacterised protein [Porphyromonas macacae]